jgi:predicted O-methyltransferase YrrM
VFDLVTKCFYDKTIYAEYQVLKNYRKSLLENKNFIEVQDFSAGSKVFKSNKRQISQIAKTAGISKKRAQLLFRIVKYFKPKQILELGTSLGLATSALSLGTPKAKIISLEGCPKTLKQCQKHMLHTQSQQHSLSSRAQSRDIFNNVQFINTEFSTYLKTINQQPTTFDFIYLDSNHSQRATLEYFDLLLPTVTNDSVWIFDDIHWSKDMEEAWQTIKNHPKVTVTVDTFQWGIIFFRAEQEKEHFVVRV